MKRIFLIALGLSLGFATSALADKGGGGSIHLDNDSDGLCDAIDLSTSDDLTVVYVDDGMDDCEVALDDGTTLVVSQDEETSSCEAGPNSSAPAMVMQLAARR